MKVLRGILNFNTEVEFVIKTKFNKIYINEYIFTKIKTNFELDIDRIFIFKIGKIDIYINRNMWIKPLEKCLICFENIEDYEKCKTCKFIINEIKNENM